MKGPFLESLVGLMISVGTVSAQDVSTWSLEQCIDYAITHNITIRQREIDRQQSEIDLNTAKWSRTPNLSASSSYSFNFGRSLSRNNTYESVNSQNLSGNISAGMPLFTGMRIPNEIKRSQLNLMAATEDLGKAKDDISLSVTSAYLQVLYTHDLNQVATEQLALSKELHLRKKAYFKVGKVSESDVLEAASRVAQDEVTVVQTQNDYQLAMLELSQLLELDSLDSLSIQMPEVKADDYYGKTGSPIDIFNQAVIDKPVVMAAQYRLQSAGHAVNIAKSGYYPQLNLGGGLGTNYYKLSGMATNNSFGKQLRDNFSQYIGLQLSIPIFDRFETRNRVRQARLQQMSLKWQLEDIKKNLFKEIQQAYYRAHAAESKYKSCELAEQASNTAYRVMKAKYEAGIANSTDYNQARTAWLKTQTDKVQAMYDFVFRIKILDFYRGQKIRI